MSFLLIRFAEGSAGSFLMSVLAASESVWHWDKETQDNKTEDLSFQYIQKTFKPDFEFWILRDPKPQNDYNLHFISTKYPRGNELSLSNFKENCARDASKHFFQGQSSGKHIALPWHKIDVPSFLEDPLVVTIKIDQPSLRWYHRSLWRKKFGIKNGMIHIKADDPVYNPARAEYFAKFNNPYLINQSVFSFVKENVISNKQKLAFLMPADVPNNSMIELSSLLEEDKFVKGISDICTSFNILKPTNPFIRECHRYWMSCHV